MRTSLVSSLSKGDDFSCRRNRNRDYLNKRGNIDSVLGYWKISIDGQDTNLWKDRTKFKKDTEFTSKSFYKQSDKKWLKNGKFKFNLHDNNLQWRGKWVDINRECINTNNQLKDENLCLHKKSIK